jgi:hypothetical protein
MGSQVRRVLSFSLGLGIGLVIGGNLVRRLDAVQQRFSPDRIGVAAAAFVDRARDSVADVLGARRPVARDPFSTAGGTAGPGAAGATGGQVVEHPTARRSSGARPWTR